jgi:branched-chain amino acid transport system substrate-binding protein
MPRDIQREATSRIWSIWVYLFKVKSPEQSRYRFDYCELLATIPGNEAFKPQEEGGCPLLSKK